jgi:sugar/nucleoside kinase (ribokinase family)
MRPMANEAQRFAVFGEVLREYILTGDGAVHLDLLGGSATYAALAARLWGAAVLPLAILPPSFPDRLLSHFRDAGIPTDGLLRVPTPDDHLAFYAYSEDGQRAESSPTRHFLKANMPIPKELLGYTPRVDLPAPSLAPLLQQDHEDALRLVLSSRSCAHIAPLAYPSQAILTGRLRELGIRCLTLDPHASFLHPWHRDNLAALMNGLDAFLVSERLALQFFRPATPPSTWKMAEYLAGFGCRYVVVKQGVRGLALWDGYSGRRWHVPAYPTTVRDPTGAGDAFAGGFLVGLAETQDPLEAALMGAVSASLTIERSGATEILASLPGLANARLGALRCLVKAM